MLFLFNFILLTINYGSKKAKSDIGQEKRKIVRSTIKVKKEIITKHKNGICVSDLVHSMVWQSQQDLKF